MELSNVTKDLLKEAMEVYKEWEMLMTEKGIKTESSNINENTLIYIALSNLIERKKELMK